MKREVIMCDKPGCDCAAAGACVLCDADVCTRDHATQPRLKAEVKDGGFVAVPLPVLICKDCAEATLVERGDEASPAKYVVDKWPDDIAERLKPLFEIIRAGLAKRALGKNTEAAEAPGEPGHMPYPCTVCGCADYSTDYSTASHNPAMPPAACHCGHALENHQL